MKKIQLPVPGSPPWSPQTFVRASFDIWSEFLKTLAKNEHALLVCKVSEITIHAEYVLNLDTRLARCHQELSPISSFTSGIKISVNILIS